MLKLKMWGWDKKERTMLRYIKPGDIFCFRFNAQTYCFGRIISEALLGHISEIFDYTSSSPTISEKNLEEANRLLDLIILSSYVLFDKKSSGEWRIIGHQEDYVPNDVDGIYFTYGVGKSCKKVDVMGNETPIDESEKSNYFTLASRIDDHIKKLVASKLNIEPDLSLENKRRNPNKKLAPFILSEGASGMSLLLDAGSYKNEVFKELSKEGSIGNGYEWASLAKIFLSEKLPNLIAEIQFDPEADMFCAYSPNKQALEEFAVAFHAMCEDEGKMRGFFSRAEID